MALKKKTGREWGRGPAHTTGITASWATLGIIHQLTRCRKCDVEPIASSKTEQRLM